MLKKIFKMSGLKLSFLITFVFAGMFFWNLINPTGGSFIEVLDLKFIDFIMKSRGTIRHGNEVVIAAVDTKAVDKYGRWPWSRDKMAILVKALNNHYKAKVIGFDIVFSESDNNYKTAKKIIDQYRKIENSSSNSITSRRLKAIRQNFAKNLNHDAKFGKELSSWENIVLGYFIWTSDEGIKHLTKQEKGKLEERVASSAISIIQGRHFLKDSYMPNRGVGVEPNIPLLAPSNSLHGALNFIPDFTDGIARRVHLLWEFNGEYYPNLDLQMLRRYYDNKPIRLISNESGVQEIRIGSKIISTAGDGSIYINYKGPSFTFSHYSVYDIINKTVPIEKLKGKIILVGGTETGIFDLRATPVGASFPGVEVHANVIENIIHDDYLSQDDLSKLVTLALILTLGILMGLVVPRVGAIVGVIFSLILLIGYVVADLWVFNHYNTWASFSYVTLVIILNWFAIILYRFLVEEKDKRFIQGAFKQYLSPDVIDRLVANPNLLKLGGERKELTAFFSDVQGFSTISESLEPEELVELLNEYLTEMTEIVMKYDGTVDKFEGDAIIAFFGAPIDHKDHAIRACLVSIEMQEKLAEMREMWREQGKHELFMRIGLNTGQMVVGNMGSKTRMDYTMMGDSVNLAARLEGVNKQYKTFTMISEFTYTHIKDEFDVRELDMIRVVGKNKPVRVYEVLGKTGTISEEQKKGLPYFLKGLSLYRKMEFDEAQKYFKQAVQIIPNDGPSEIYIQRCTDFINNPPEINWDGVYQMTSK